MPRPIIGFVGMTHLGLVSAVAAAEKGFSVVCVDSDAGIVEGLVAGSFPVSEPQLPQLFEVNRSRLTFSTAAAALDACDVVYVAPDVATDDEGRSDLSGVIASLDLAIAHTREDAVIVILSQVQAGFTRANAPNGRPVFYQAETLIFGDAVARALEPERFIVGAGDPGAPLPEPYRRYLESFDCPLLVMRYESAELAKISINCFLAASISATNTLAELCETVGADWSEIAPALRLDKRIGPHAYLAPGLGIAGGNLERDLVSVCRMADDHGTDSGVVSSWLENSAYRKQWVYRTLNEKILATNPQAKIAVLGLAYKENTDSTKNAPSLALLSRLSDAELRVYDPVVRACGFAGTVVSDSPMDAVREADAVAIMTPWDEFRRLDVSALAEAMAGTLVIDPYGLLDRHSAIAAGLDYLTLGVS